MHLKSITLKGFKSFPDRTTLEFGPGVSVIVGPNGSGKSNVTDAVLWAMGEQSPHAVRGQSMQDVIFGGARGQQARQAAEVEVVIDNADGRLDVPFSELSIFRRLDRSGDGEYRLNGAKCRLVDVLEALSDTGLGKEMHSIVSQGRIESVVSSKPKDRRLMIEEAAGLGKHRKRRRRAQLKLARTQDNLDRALDVEREARARLKPLKRQAEAAELHERIERQSIEARWELVREEARAGRAGLQVAQDEATAARAVRDLLDADLAQVAARREQVEQTFAERGALREENARRCFATRSAGERVAMRADQAAACESMLRERVARATARLETAEAQRDGDEPDSEAIARIEALRAQFLALERDREAELEHAVAELSQRREAAAAQVVIADQAVAGATAAASSSAAGAQAARGECRVAEQAVESARRDAAAVGAELAAVNHFLRAHTGAPGGATALVDELAVDSGLELALAATLGRRMRAAIARDLASGSALLDGAGADGGSALVSTSLTEPPAGKAPAVGAARLVDHVHGPRDAIALARFLLADVWVVESLRGLEPGFSGTAVTRGGRVWFAATRELRQAPTGGEDRVLAERNRREHLIARSEDAVAAEHAALSAVEHATAQVAGADVARVAADDALRDAVRDRDQAEEEVRRVDWSITQRREASDEGAAGTERARVQAALEAETRLAQRADAARRERLAQIDALRDQARADTELAPVAARLSQTLASVVAALAERGSAQEADLAADRHAGDRLAGELRECAQREATIQGELRTRGEAVTQSEVRAQQARDRAAEAERELLTLAQRLELTAEPATEPLDDEQRDALSSRIERLARRRDALGPVNPLAQDEYADALAYVEELETQRNDLETALRELEGLIKETDRRIREAFETTFEATARNFEEVVGHLFPGGRGRLALVKEERPRAILGGAQPPTKDQDAVPGAAQAASEAAADAEEPVDVAAGPDEDLGVEIEMTPAGKSMKRLSLLSGGEKSLTALAFLFSVFLARPCPFYVLDEVEAALDDLNIDRFLTLLRRYAGESQFLVVTHQKRTMDAADTLYGVSMSDDGVSKVVSRRLPARDAQAVAEVA